MRDAPCVAARSTMLSKSLRRNQSVAPPTHWLTSTRLNAWRSAPCPAASGRRRTSDRARTRASRPPFEHARRAPSRRRGRGTLSMLRRASGRARTGPDTAPPPAAGPARRRRRRGAPCVRVRRHAAVACCVGPQAIAATARVTPMAYREALAIARWSQDRRLVPHRHAIAADDTSKGGR